MQGILAGHIESHDGKTCLVYSENGLMWNDTMRGAKPIAALAYDLAEAMLEEKLKREKSLRCRLK